MTRAHNIDCIDFMKTKPDKHYDIAIVDPPYGLGKKLAHAGNGKNAQSNFSKEFKEKNWDVKPSKEYFDQLFRVSKNQIIFGGNYFELPPTRCFITWDKMVYIPTMSQIELAWTSYDRLPLMVKINNSDPNRIHLTQKPIALYRFIMQKFCKKGSSILDTHLGSGSSRIAAYQLGYDFDGLEIDTKFFMDQENRFENTITKLELGLINI